MTLPRPVPEATNSLSAGGFRELNRREVMGEAFEGILAAARTGAEWAWSALYRELSPAVLGYLRAQRAREPEDLTGEVFYQVVRSLGQFEGDEAAFRSWVFVIAHRKLIDDARYRKRRPVEPSDTPRLRDGVRAGNVEQEALDRLSTAALDSLLAQLTDDQRSVLLLRILADLSTEETARALGKRKGAVEALQHRALARLRKTLSSA